MTLGGLPLSWSAPRNAPVAAERAGVRVRQRAARPALAALLALLVLPAAASAADGLSLTAADSGREVAVAPGAAIVITLESNASTGYHWIVATEPDPAVLVAAPDNGEYTAPETDLIGAGGVQTFAYTAGDEGSTWLLLHYVAPGTKEVGETFELYVEVRAGAGDGAAEDELPATGTSMDGEAGGRAGDLAPLALLVGAFAVAAAVPAIRRARTSARI